MAPLIITALLLNKDAVSCMWFRGWSFGSQHVRGRSCTQIQPRLRPGHSLNTHASHAKEIQELAPCKFGSRVVVDHLGFFQPLPGMSPLWGGVVANVFEKPFPLRFNPPLFTLLLMGVEP